MSQSTLKERKSCTAFHEAQMLILCTLQRRSWTMGWDCCSRAQETVWMMTLRSSVNLMSAERWEAQFIICLWRLSIMTENLQQHIFHIMCWLLTASLSALHHEKSTSDPRVSIHLVAPPLFGPIYHLGKQSSTHVKYHMYFSIPIFSRSHYIKLVMMMMFASFWHNENQNT